MRRVGITGIGCLSGAGVGAEKLLSAMRGPGFPVEAVEIETIRGRR